MGDEVLKHVARCIDRFITPLGGICCRVTADNFAVLYPSALMDTEMLRQNHRDTTAPACLSRPISIRIGRYIVADKTLSASAMYDRATLAEVSVRGRYDVYIARYDESMRTEILREQEVVNEMNGALAGGQFEVWFQPQFNHSYLYARPMPASDYEAFVVRFCREKEMITLSTVQTLDNNTFWDPGSMETLIFNSYVGGACIFEYHNGKPELLRINDTYAAELGGNLTAEEAHALDLGQYLDEQNRACLMDNIRQAIQTGKESACEVVLVGLNGAEKRTYIRATVRVIASAGSRYLLYCSIFNMTELRETERKEREATKQLLTMMDDTPGGFCRIELHPEGPPAILYANDGFCELLGMTRAEVMQAYGKDAWGCVHPDDSDLAAASRKMAFDGGRFTARCRLRRGDGAYVAVMVFGRFAETDAGELYLNAYFTELPDGLWTQTRQTGPSDNTPAA